jgi:hypothetical protein
MLDPNIPRKTANDSATLPHAHAIKDFDAVRLERTAQGQPTFQQRERERERERENSIIELIRFNGTSCELRLRCSFIDDNHRVDWTCRDRCSMIVE